jgi:hypothetical protein
MLARDLRETVERGDLFLDGGGDIGALVEQLRELLPALGAAQVTGEMERRRAVLRIDLE